MAWVRQQEDGLSVWAPTNMGDPGAPSFYLAQPGPLWSPGERSSDQSSLFHTSLYLWLSNKQNSPCPPKSLVLSTAFLPTVLSLPDLPGLLALYLLVVGAVVSA